MPTFTSLAEIAEAARGCLACGLCKTRTQVVPGEGAEHPEILFIGEGPGFHEDRQGRPFVGAAGKLLDEMLASIGLKRSDVYITNVVKCRPPGNRDPLPEEIEACGGWLREQLGLIKPKLIVTLGRHAMGRFLPNETITKVHGMPRRAGGYLIMPMYHPAAALYQASLKQTLLTDFAKIPAVLRAAEGFGLGGTAPTPPPQAVPAGKQAEKPQQQKLF